MQDILVDATGSTVRGVIDIDPAWALANRALWDEAAPLHASSAFYDLAAFVEGRDSLHEYEPDELGSVVGSTLLHLQCHIGTDTLSWARRGATVMGLDFSEASLRLARTLAIDCGLDAEFICADVYDAGIAVGPKRFDVVYTGVGALLWLPELAPWAEVVASLVKPRGVLYVNEIHPLLIAMSADGRTIEQDLVDAPVRRIDEPGGTYAAPDAILEHTVTYERNHAISEIVSALLDTDCFGLELLHEHSMTRAPYPCLRRDDDGYYRLPPESPKFPLGYSIRMRRTTSAPD
jgi:SAM-dependent methyltransferase